MRTSRIGLVLVVLLLMVCSTMMLGVVGKANGRPSQSVTVEWWYKYDENGDLMDKPSPFHVHTVHKGQDTSRTITEVIEWDYRTIYFADGSSFRKFFFLGYSDESFTETFWKTTCTYDDFVINDDPGVPGEPWDMYPDEG
jgi:hypothetical protein